MSGGMLWCVCGAERRWLKEEEEEEEEEGGGHGGGVARGDSVWTVTEYTMSLTAFPPVHCLPQASDTVTIPNHPPL